MDGVESKVVVVEGRGNEIGDGPSLYERQWVQPLPQRGVGAWPLIEGIELFVCKQSGVHRLQHTLCDLGWQKR